MDYSKIKLSDYVNVTDKDIKYALPTPNGKCHGCGGELISQKRRWCLFCTRHRNKVNTRLWREKNRVKQIAKLKTCPKCHKKLVRFDIKKHCC